VSSLDTTQVARDLVEPDGGSVPTDVRAMTDAVFVARAQTFRTSAKWRILGVVRAVQGIDGITAEVAAAFPPDQARREVKRLRAAARRIEQVADILESRS